MCNGDIYVREESRDGNTQSLALLDRGAEDDLCPVRQPGFILSAEQGMLRTPPLSLFPARPLAHLSLHRPAGKVIKHHATWQTRLDVRALLDQPVDGALGDVEPLCLGDGLDLPHEGVTQRQGLVRGLEDPVGLHAGDGGE